MMRDVMVDLETTGTSPDRCAILQIAAVRFDLKTREVDASNMFNRCLMMPPWRHWEEDCRQWWSRNPPHILQGIVQRSEKPDVVINAFADWCGYSEPLVMWAKPLSFEWPFLQGYFKDFEVHNPFNFRTAMDCRSYLTGLLGDFISDKDIKLDGDAHDAIFDVLHQIKWLFANQDKADAQA